MKKALFVLMALLIASPAMAVTFKVTDNANLTATIGYEGNGTSAATRARAFGLTISVDNGAKITDVTGFPTGEGAKYGIFPGTIVIANGAVSDYNKPVEPATLPGAAGTGIGTSSIVVAMGSLYVGEANAPAAAGTLLTITVDKACNVTVAEEDAYRGGVVMEDANSPTVASVTKAITAPVTECLKNTAPEYAVWVSFNRPDCWCFKKQCNGDINGTSSFGKPVTTADLNILKSAFNKDDATLRTITNGICADLNHAASFGKRVTTADLNTLKNYFNDAEATVPQCAVTYINFWKN